MSSTAHPTRRRGWAIALITALIAAPLVVAENILDAEPASATYATGGAGEYQGSIDWITWSDRAGVAISNESIATSTRSIDGHDLTTTCKIENLSGAVNTYVSGAWRGDALDNLYNVGGSGGNNKLVNALTTAVDNGKPTFDVSCATTLDGVDVGIAGLVMADAEASSWPSTVSRREYIQATPTNPDTTWRIIERLSTCGTNVIAELTDSDNIAPAAQRQRVH